MTGRFEPKIKPRLNVLQPEDIEEVYSATMEVMERTGRKDHSSAGVGIVRRRRCAG